MIIQDLPAHFRMKPGLLCRHSVHPNLRAAVIKYTPKDKKKRYRSNERYRFYVVYIDSM